LKTCRRPSPIELVSGSYGFEHYLYHQSPADFLPISAYLNDFSNGCASDPIVCKSYWVCGRMLRRLGKNVATVVGAGRNQLQPARWTNNHHREGCRLGILTLFLNVAVCDALCETMEASNLICPRCASSNVALTGTAKINRNLEFEALISICPRRQTAEQQVLLQRNARMDTRLVHFVLNLLGPSTSPPSRLTGDFVSCLPPA
jgi:hypothetical protein